MNAPKKIFISYRRDDSSSATEWLYQLLAAKFGRKNVYKDVNNLKFGEDFVQSIERAITTCNVLIAVIGPRWGLIKDEDGRRRIDLPGDFVRKEIETALKQDILVIPVLFDDAEMPDSRTLPPSLQPFARRHAIWVAPTHFKRDTKVLISFIRQELSADTWWGRLQSRMDDLLYALESAWRYKVVILGILSALVLASGVGIALWLGNRSTPLPQSATPLPENVLVWRRQIGFTDSPSAFTIDLVDTNGAKVRTLLSDRKNRAPILTPDRRTVLYIRDTNDSAEIEDLELRAIAVDGAGDRLLFRARDIGCPILKRPAIRADLRLAVACQQSEEGMSSLTLRELDGTLVKDLDEGYLDDPTFTHDGKSVVYWRAQNTPVIPGGSLYQASTDTSSRPVRLTQSDDGVDAFQAMSPTDNRLVFTRRVNKTRQDVMILASLDPGAQASQITGGSVDSGISWSPDGQSIAFLRESQNKGTLIVMNLGSGGLTPVATNEATYTGRPAWTAR